MTQNSIVAVRRASPDDANSLSQLGARTFAEAFAADNTSEDMDSYLASKFSVEQLAAQLAEVGYSGLDRTLNVHIRNLRRKIEDDPARPRRVETIRGRGYRFGLAPS